jgi:hypothetical protein
MANLPLGRGAGQAAQRRTTGGRLAGLAEIPAIIAGLPTG